MQHRVAAAVTVATRGAPHIVLEEFDGEDVIVRIKATPEYPPEGARLAGQVLEAVTSYTEAARSLV